MIWNQSVTSVPRLNSTNRQRGKSFTRERRRATIRDGTTCFTSRSAAPILRSVESPSNSPVLCSLPLTCALCRSKLRRNSSDPRATSAARVVARALGEQGPAGEAVLQKSALLQVMRFTSSLVQRLFGLTRAHRFQTGGVEQQRLRLGSAGDRVGPSSPQLSAVGMAG